MEAVIEKTERLTGLALCRKMLSEKKETQRQMREEWVTDPDKMKILNELIKENETRGRRTFEL